MRNVDSILTKLGITGNRRDDGCFSWMKRNGHALALRWSKYKGAFTFHLIFPTAGTESLCSRVGIRHSKHTGWTTDISILRKDQRHHDVPTIFVHHLFHEQADEAMARAVPISQKLALTVIAELARYASIGR